MFVMVLDSPSSLTVGIWRSLRITVFGTYQGASTIMCKVFDWKISRISMELDFFLLPTDSRPVRLGIGPPFGTLDHILSSSSFFC
jgi:hypothetical protein